MKNLKKLLAVLVVVAIIATTAIIPAFATETLSDDATICKDLGVLLGGEDGVTVAYTKTQPDRVQAALLFLRLKGVGTEAEAYAPTNNFSDVSKHWGKNVTGFLFDHQEYGFVGDAGKFMPNDKMTAQMYYKVMLVALGYVESADFQYANVMSFAASKGLTSLLDVGATSVITIDQLASATVETLKAKVKGTETTLVAKLVADKVIDGQKAADAGIYTIPPVVAPVNTVTGMTATNLKEIVIAFSMELDSAKVTTANFTVGGVASASATLSADKKSVTVVPAAISATNKADYAVKVLKAAGLGADYSGTVRAFDTTIPVTSSVTLTGPQTFDILFSEPILTAGTVKVNNGIYGVTLGAVGTNKLTVTLAASALPEGNYTINVAGFKDYAGFAVDSTDFTLAYVKNVVAPVASISGTPTQTTVVVAFDKAVTLDATSGYVDYFYHTFSAWAPNSVVKSADSKTYTLTFTTYPIPQGTANVVVKYKGAIADSEIKDAWGNKVTANITLPVTVAADVTAPSVTSVAVTNEQTVVVNFSESLNAAAAKAIAETPANYVVKDSAGTAVTTAFTATYAETPASSIYKVTLAFASKLTGGNYTVDIKNIADGALTNNIMPTITQAFAITDLTPIDFAVATDVKVTAIESTAASVADIIYVTFAEKMAIEGQYSVLDANNYLLNSAAFPAGTTLTAFGSTGKVVKITVPENATFNQQTVVGVNNLTIARVADLAGNKTAALTGTRSVIGEVPAVVTAVKQTDSNKLTVTIDKPLSVVLASGFTAAKGAGTVVEVAAIDSWSVNSSNNTIVNLTLNSGSVGSLTDTSDIITDFDTVANILVAETGTKMAAADYTGLIKDYRAPKLIATSPIASGTVKGTIEVKFTEALDAVGGIDALYANDLVVTKTDGTVLVAGLDYTTALKGGDAKTIVISFPAAFAASTTYKVSSKATINYIRDAVVGINTKATAFPTSVDAIAVDNVTPTATSVATIGTKTVVFTFSEAVYTNNAAPLTDVVIGDFTVVDGAGADIGAATLTVSADKKTVTIVFAGTVTALDTVSITAASIYDAGGNAVAAGSTGIF